MPRSHRSAGPRSPRKSLFGLAGIVCSLAPAPASWGQAAPAGNALFGQMVGTWSVQQRMWPRAGAPPSELPRAVARRRLVGGSFLEEVMELPPGSSQQPFTRVAYFNYNAVNQQYEYFSLDSRAPQMMSERSVDAGSPVGGINLFGGSFVAPQWGDATNATFRYRLLVDAVAGNRQVVELYLTPLSAESPKEFLAFQYVYSRQPG